MLARAHYCRPMSVGWRTDIGSLGLDHRRIGAAGLTAAIRAAQEGLAVLVLEKADHFSGTTATSGGGMWIADNGRSGSFHKLRTCLNIVRSGLDPAATQSEIG